MTFPSAKRSSVLLLIKECIDRPIIVPLPLIKGADPSPYMYLSKICICTVYECVCVCTVLGIVM